MAEMLELTLEKKKPHHYWVFGFSQLLEDVT
jgi:hypothetical protein